MRDPSWLGTLSYALTLLLFSWSEFGDALGGHDIGNLEAVIEQIWKYTWRPCESGFGELVARSHRASLEICTLRT